MGRARGQGRRVPRRLSATRWALPLVVGVGLAALAPATSAAGLVASPTVVSGVGADTYPSQEQVDQARREAASAQSGVAQAQATYDAAAVELQRLQGQVAEKAALADAAARALADQTAAADAAAAEADRLSAASADATHAVQIEAALMWQTPDVLGDSLSMLVSAAGPQEAADMASTMDHLASVRQATLGQALGSANTAAEARRAADAAREQQRQASAAADAARDSARAEADSASARTATLLAEQQRMVSELARLNGVADSVEQQRQDGIAADAARAAAEAAAAAAAAAQAAAATSWTPPVVDTSGTGGGGLSPGEARAAARSMMGGWGFGDDQWGCLDSLWTGESDWQWWARNPSSGAYGIPQSLPASKMATAGGDWLTSATTQISWGLSYIQGRYGTPCGAWSAWLARSPHWY